MVDIKTAVQNATAFARESLGPERAEHLRLEEIQSLNEGGNQLWQITLSNPIIPEGPFGSIGRMQAALGVDMDREYKVFTVDKGTGDVLSMKIRVFSDVPLR